MTAQSGKMPGSLVLRGLEGLVEGEIFQINPGESVVLGRSRSCDISLRKCFKYLALDAEERKNDKHFQTVSRRHLRLSFRNSDEVEIENMGANGTFIDGSKVDKVIITDARHKPHELTLGTREKFALEWREGDFSPELRPGGTLDENVPDGAVGHEEGPTKRVGSKAPESTSETAQD